MPICKNCNKEFPNKINIDGETKALIGRKFCLECSPHGGRNTRSYIIKLDKNQAYCARCRETKNKSEFYVRKSSGKPFSYCIKCQETVKALKFEEKLERMILERGGVCNDCGIPYPMPVYEFYSESDIYHLSKAKNMSLHRLREEVKDYILLCKNCSVIRKWVLSTNVN
jgi:hypothetical protein